MQYKALIRNLHTLQSENAELKRQLAEREKQAPKTYDDKAQIISVEANGILISSGKINAEELQAKDGRFIAKPLINTNYKMVIEYGHFETDTAGKKRWARGW